MKSVHLSESQNVEGLIARSVAGDHAALNELFSSHVDFVYNILVRLYANPELAQDATQEVLLKALTSLSNFKSKSKFSTWLYSIALNHFRSEWRKSTKVTPTLSELPEEVEDSLAEEAVNDVKSLCSLGMLLCLDEDQRIVFVLGDVFNADDVLGGELLGVSPGNFRVRLSRARSDLRNYVWGKCGLVNSDNPCTCPKKTKQLISAGIYDQRKRVFTTQSRLKIRDISESVIPETSDKIWNSIRDLFQSQPFLAFDELKSIISKVNILNK